MADKPIDMDKLKNQVEAYGKVRPVYEVFAEVLQAALSQAVRDLDVSAIVQARAKAVPSFAGKVVRKLEKYPDPVNQLTDLCGARVITQCRDEIEPICDFIRKHFDIDEANSEDVLERLGAAEFGYRSVHFVVSLKPGEFDGVIDTMAESKRDAQAFRAAVSRLHERRSAQECATAKLPPGPKFKAEIQVRTLLQHAWAAFAHDRIYKSDFEVPRRWQRDANRTAAMLEEADEAFARTIRGVEGYQTYHGAYMAKGEREAETSKLEAALEYDPGNMRLAHKIARLAISLEDWPRAQERLGPFVQKWEHSAAAEALKKAWQAARSGRSTNDVDLAQLELERLRDTRRAAVLADYGWALWKRGNAAGRDYLEWATALDPASVDARVALADTYMDADMDMALECYERASQADPSDPRALAGFLYCKLAVERSPDFIPLVKPSLEAAIARCRERASVGVYLPRAFYDIGMFSLLVGRPYDAVIAYAKAVQLSDSDSPIDTALTQMERLRKSLRDQLPELEWVSMFLRAAKAAKLLQLAAAAESRGDAAAATSARDAAEAARTECMQALATRDGKPFGEPVVLVAGAGDRAADVSVQDYRPLLQTAFQNFSGTLCACGANGLAGIIGDLPTSSCGPLCKVAYLPSAAPPGTTVHSAYEVRLTSGQRFSALEPLQNWIDLLASGTNPADVKVLGVGGGQIARLELRVALALGAKVGVLRDSGAAAAEVLVDEDWLDAPGLLMLPSDAQTVRAFVLPVPQSKALDAATRENMAKQAHDRYRSNQKARHRSTDPAMSDWESLTPDLKRSNLDQIDHIEEKLRAVGMRVRKVGTCPAGLTELPDDVVEVMSEMEHGRWNVERLLSGWTLGERDVERKTAPYLVSWAELPEEIREYDRQAVRAIPELLKAWGYEVVAEEKEI